MSKGPQQWPVPIFAESGQGAHVRDVDGTLWLDWSAALGPCILGYSNAQVTSAIAEQLFESGVLFPAPNPLEVEVAERICAMTGFSKVRLGKTGSDAVAAAVRCARVWQELQNEEYREWIVVRGGGYHGWHDWFAATTERNAGTQAHTQTTYNKSFGKPSRALVAAVVVEPDRCSIEELKTYRAECDDWGAVLIFDEVITGFRLAPGGATEAYGVRPDLVCYGKALANGMPLSALAGDEVMGAFDHGFWSTTHAGECLSLAAAKATLDQLADGDVLRAIAGRGEWLREYLTRYGLDVTGEPSHLIAHFPSPEERTWVLERVAADQILWNGHFFGMAPHTDEDVHFTIQAFQQILKVPASKRIPAGPVLAPVYRTA